MTQKVFPKVIIFDWDNTLVNSWSVIQDALNTTFRAYGLREWEYDEVCTKVRKSLRDSFPDLFGNSWREAGDLFYSRYAEIHSEKINPICGAEKMLKELRILGIRLAIVSNKKGTFLRKESKTLGWDHYFEKIIGASDTKFDKPNRAPVDLILAAINIETGPEVWFVGDTDIDMECAYNSKCTPVLLRKKNISNSSEFLEFPPTYHFQSCFELCNYITNM